MLHLGIKIRLEASFRKILFTLSLDIILWEQSIDYLGYTSTGLKNQTFWSILERFRALDRLFEQQTVQNWDSKMSSF